ncbi:uncharacterized protein TM35_000016960 [Trypanosoma theileri]|uniref:GRIP domain-containing protein n=1 Tax=Trypanosoma theileri TaxID=67003 RepID=A0A1X0PB65_9TRYP|nr:uncharacterized protein TM35_000016960 [Trypanosoma theileri]ORC93819.1 hypothetical protein TM35_000016960 [Trypanosoma theileri]
MEGESCASTEETSVEVGRLQEELSKAKERLQQWKEKTQIGVNELRSRIVELTRELEETRAANVQLKEQLDNKTEGANAATATFLSTPSPLTNILTSWINDSTDIFTSTSLAKSSIALDMVASVSLEFDKYKRRTIQTLRMQTKNLESLQVELSDVRHQLNSALDDLNERKCAIESRDEAISVLQNRLDDLEATNARLESTRATMVNKPNMEQIDVFQERLEKEIENVQREFASRESIIFDQHRDEIERLVAKHDEEVAELRAELEDRRLAGMVVNMEGRSNNEASEVAYAELMADFESLRDELKVTQDENQKLLKKLQEMKERSVCSNGSVSNENNSGGVLRGSLTLPEALARIAELEGGTKRLSDELCEAKKRLIATKHQANNNSMNNNNKDNNRPQVLEGQQLSYLKFIVVKLLCANGDVHVSMNLFPVLSTLLHFNSTDLENIYAANPDWVKRKF